jgi:16S rRNA U1498 N3-methylase RsmE
VAAVAQFRVDDPNQPTLNATDEHHLRTVLRARSGEELVVTDGAGAWSLCEVGDHALHRVTPVHIDPPSPSTTLYLSPLKGDRSEWTVVKATELGVHRIVPLMSARVVVKFRGEVRDKIVARWRRVANEANGQSRRTYDVIIMERRAQRLRGARRRLGRGGVGRTSATLARTDRAARRNGRRGRGVPPGFRRWWVGIYPLQ